ncbi:suppressor of fused domain protein [Aliiroseovarius sp. KMU-50]|uniref:Suppressor of fused domain protein n=1 Tax=Aliiroseovarius salicola TaxID=3009082 RepID=A0ABT4VX81_9RHOB|nr:suppressor of fused domain protein [Aliiroseovarius sp. KMU-50]MDA5092863.1 suppressor of fused domain protein [Aliiroseovarius sp. KMU-50]
MISKENKQIANFLSATFAGVTSIFPYSDEELTTKTSILSSKNSPCDGVTSYATIGLSDLAIAQTESDGPLGVELLSVCSSNVEDFPNILATAAFNIIKDGWDCFPGAIHLDVVKLYGSSNSMSHILLTDPYIWERELRTLELKTKTVAWLLAVPISDTERLFLEAHGADALETIFENEQIDIFNIDRDSVV